MNTIIEEFYNGKLFSKYELESEVEKYQQIVKEYEDSGVYQGDSYYQDSLMTLSALKEALEEYDHYYDTDGIYIKNID